MKVSLAFVSAVAAAAPVSPFSNDNVDLSKIPSSYESAVMGRRILALTKLATLSTVFPSSSSSGGPGTFERRPEGLGGLPVGLMDYVADCEEEGNPTIVAIKIATTFKNVRAGSNITLSMRWTPPYPPSKRISLFGQLASLIFGSSQSSGPDTVPYSASNLPRFSLVGYMEDVDPPSQDARVALEKCFTAKHPDAKYWLPGNKAVHESEWKRLVVQQVYWIGGFGDRAYIGWIPVEEWKNVTREEWEGIELPGERKGWNEWSLGEL